MAVQATMFALFERLTGDGTGQVVDVSLYESLFRLFPGDVEKYDRLGQLSERRGNHHANAAPRNVYETTDGYVALSASADATFENVARAVGRPELLEDERFATNADRVAHADALDEQLAPWFAERSTEAAVERMTEADAVVAPIYDMSDVFEDEQYAAREDIVAVDDDQLGEMRTPGALPKLSRTPGGVDHLGPRHGEHTETVFREELGLDADRYERLREAGVL
jgi:formyl-CoA transferase